MTIHTASLQAEIARLKRGDFTRAEFQGLCHHLDERTPGCSFHEFAQGCHFYQQRLFGKSDHERHEAEKSNLQAKLAASEAAVVKLRQALEPFADLLNGGVGRERCQGMEGDRTMSYRMFPVQTQRGAAPHPLLIPWSIAELAYSVYAGQYGKDQSLEQLAQRGGFGPGEMDMFLPGWRERSVEVVRLKDRVAQLEKALQEIRSNCGCGEDNEPCANCIRIADALLEIG